MVILLTVQRLLRRSGRQGQKNLLTETGEGRSHAALLCLGPLQAQSRCAQTVCGFRAEHPELHRIAQCGSCRIPPAFFL